MRNMSNDQKLVDAVKTNRRQKCGALSFDPKTQTFSSYAMKLAVLDPVTKTARFCSEKRSVTTSKHQSIVRRVLAALDFEIEDVSNSDDMD
jgi:hypothetical protein